MSDIKKELKEYCDWKKKIPQPICEDKPSYNILYQKAWELAYEHIRYIDGMPQNPYMDEAFCDSQVWIWDSCFMALFCKYCREVFPGVETLTNFYEVLHGDKRLGKVLVSENEPEWTGAVPGEPFEVKVHIADNPPLFAWAEYENALMSGDAEYIKELLYEKRFLQKHYEWLENLNARITPDGVTAPTYLLAEKYGYRWEGGHSGMDNTPRGRVGEHAVAPRPNNPEMLWLDAICQQALSARMIAKMYALIDDAESEAEWLARYNEKADIVNSLYWDDEDGFYYDIDRNTHKHYKIMTPASFWTMTAGIASEQRAAKLAKHVSDPETLGGRIPLPSLSRSDNDFVPDGEYWRGGVWMPTSYAAIKGLANYGMYSLAREAADKTIEYMYKTYTDFEPHTIWEAYSPTEYKPATTEHRQGILVRKDFCGWSALGPVSMFIEFVIGFHTVNAFDRVVEWHKPDEFKKALGIKNLCFADVVTDIVAEDKICTVKSNQPYTLKINEKAFQILAGEQTIVL